MSTFAAAEGETVARLTSPSLTSDKVSSGIDATKEFTKQPQSSSFSNPPHSSKIDKLSNEILFNITSQIHDAPSVVSFALTNKRHYSLTLAVFKATRLNLLCPKDVRERFVSELENYSYNVMVAAESNAEGIKTWELQNLVWIPGLAGACGSGDQLDSLTIEEHLAFIRRITQAETNVSIKALVDQSCPKPTKRNRNPKPTTANFTNILMSSGVITWNKELKGYVERLKQETEAQEQAVADEKFRLKARGLPIRRNMLTNTAIGEVWKIWSQPVIESVEYLVLKELLAGWEKNVIQREQGRKRGAQ